MAKKDLQEKSKMPKWLKVIFTGTSAILFIVAMCHLIKYSDSSNGTMIVSFIIISIGLMLLCYVDFSKITFAGFSLELFKEVKDITRRQLTNTVVKKNFTEDYFWIDEEGDGYKLIDENTAHFLAGVGGIISDDMQNIRIKGTIYASVKEAKIKYHDKNYFLEYNTTLYYQSGIAWIYKIAALQSINMNGKAKEWKTNSGELWAAKLTNEDLLKFKVKNM